MKRCGGFVKITRRIQCAEVAECEIKPNAWKQFLYIFNASQGCLDICKLAAIHAGAFKHSGRDIDAINSRIWPAFSPIDQVHSGAASNLQQISLHVWLGEITKLLADSARHRVLAAALFKVSRVEVVISSDFFVVSRA